MTDKNNAPIDVTDTDSNGVRTYLLGNDGFPQIAQVCVSGVYSDLAASLQGFVNAMATSKAKSIISSGATRGKAFSWAKRQARRAALGEGA